MTITTKFNVGQEVLFLNESSVTKATIRKITVEVHGYGLAEGKEPEPLVNYLFDGRNRHGGEMYRYESEVAATVEDLIKLHAPKISE